MTSITIHGLEDPLDSLIRERARQQGLSLNKAIKQVLAESLGVSQDGQKNRTDFADLCGVWSQDDLAEFARNTQDFAIVDLNDWQ